MVTASAPARSGQVGGLGAVAQPHVTHVGPERGADRVHGLGGERPAGPAREGVRDEGLRETSGLLFCLGRRGRHDVQPAGVGDRGGRCCVRGGSSTHPLASGRISWWCGCSRER